MTDQTEDQSTMYVETIDQFASILAAWHQTQVDQLKHMMNVPKGTSIDVELEQGKPEKLKLTGNTMKGFQAGLIVALGYLGQLPFRVTAEQVEEASADGVTVTHVEPTDPQVN